LMNRDSLLTELGRLRAKAFELAGNAVFRESSYHFRKWDEPVFQKRFGGET
jgi:hypothetical protein